jgi:hypothetical protein
MVARRFRNCLKTMSIAKIVPRLSPGAKAPVYFQSPPWGSNSGRPGGTLDSRPVIHCREKKPCATFWTSSGILRQFLYRRELTAKRAFLVPTGARRMDPSGARGDEELNRCHRFPGNELPGYYH